MTGTTLARRTLGTGALSVFAVGASSPLTVLVGSTVSTYAITGIEGVPLSFLVVMILLLLVAVGYVTMSRRVPHSAPFYAQLARGLNPMAGVAGAVVAMLGYNAIQICLYALVGTTVANQFGGVWWAWAIVAWVIVAILGQFRGAANAKILGSLLVLELATILLFDIAAFANPAEGTITLTSFAPSKLLVTGASAVLMFAVAAFVGVESPPAFGEEARSPKAVSWGTFGSILFLGGFYAISAWAYITAAGPTDIQKAATDPDRAPFAFLGRVFGFGMVDLATMLLVTSVLAAMTAFHATVARYIFALAREHVLPNALARVSGGANGGAPLAGSIVQSVTAAAVVVPFVLQGADPMATMFVWLSAIGAICILLLLTVSSAAAFFFFNAGGGTHESVMVRQVIPVVGAIVGVLVLLFLLGNLSVLLGTAPGSLVPYVVLGLVVAAIVVGLGWGAWIARTRPDVYREIGNGTPDPLTVLDQRLSDLPI